MIIRKIWLATANNQMMITIPKSSGLRAGDYVKVERVND